MAKYYEDDFVMEVEILADNSDAEWERYQLKIIRVEQASIIYKPPKIGEVFNCDKKRDVPFHGLWRLIK